MASKSFSEIEIDAIGEIMNISLGSSATAISTMLNTRVDITTPTVSVVTKNDFSFTNLQPAVGVEITYISGLDGKNVMLLKRKDVKVIVELLMGMEIPDEEFELDEMNISAICEVMNQMMGASSTALSEFLGKVVNISTPQSFEIANEDEFKEKYFVDDDQKVVVGFILSIDGRMESEFVNVMSVELVKELLAAFLPEEAVIEEEPAAQPDIMAAQPDLGMAGGMASAGMQPDMGMPGMASPGMQPDLGMPGMAAGGMSPDMGMAGGMATPGMQPNMGMQPGMNMQPNMGMQPGMNMQPNMGMNLQSGMGMPMGGMPGVSNEAYMQQQMMLQQMMQQMQQLQDQIQVMKSQERKVLNAAPANHPELQGTGSGQDAQPENLDLVMGVPLEVSVEIGRTESLVKDILEYTKGTLIVLDKQAGDQVDLFVNGQCIAKGDVVVVDDNFGIRITEILKYPELG